MIKKCNKNDIFSLKLSSFNIGILFELKEGNYINKKNKTFDPLLYLPKDIEKIKNILKSNSQDILYFLYFNMGIIEKILYNIDEVIYFDFNDETNNFFLKINKEEIEIEQKNEIAFLFYISLLIKYNKNLLNFSFSIDLINRINLINNSIDESNIYKKLLISKIILELINYYKSNQIFEEKKSTEEIEVLNNKLIESDIHYFEDLGFEITQKDLKLKNIDIIYAKIINILLKLKKLTYKIIEELDLENINITLSMLNEISILFSNESFINEYKLNTFDDLFDFKKVDFYYILFKYILKNSIYIYYIDFLNQTRKTIIDLIKNQYLSNNYSRKIDKNLKDKVDYIIKFFVNSEYFMKYIKLSDSNLNSNLSDNEEINQSNNFKPLENQSYLEKKEESQREFSNFQSTDERNEENQPNQNNQGNQINQNNQSNQSNKKNQSNQNNQNNQNNQINQINQNSQSYKSNQSNQSNKSNQINQNNPNSEEINNSLFNSSFNKGRSQDNYNTLHPAQHNDNANISNSLEKEEKILDVINNILIESTIILIIKNNEIKYEKIIYNKEITYEHFIELYRERENQKLHIESADICMFDNCKKLIEFFDKIKGKACEFFSQKNLKNELIIIQIKIKEDNKKQNENKYIHSISSKYIYRLNNNHDENILNNDNYIGFTKFLNDIQNYLQLSTIPNKNSNNIFSTMEIISQMHPNLFICFRKIIGKHKKISEKIRELNDGNFLSDGYNEIFKYDMNFNKIESIDELKNYFSFFVDKNDAIISLKNKFASFKNLNNDTNSFNQTEISCRNLFNLDGGNYLVCDKSQILYGANVLKNNISKEEFKDLKMKKAYRGGIKIANEIFAITSNRILSKGENKLKFFEKNNKNFLSDIEVENYSFILSENNCALMEIPKQENSKLLLVACKKYVKNDKNGILLIKLQFGNNNNSNKKFPKFYDTKNFEVYCFCPILETVENKYILESNKMQIKDTGYFFVGGFDLDRREGLIKLYKVIYNDEIEKIKIEYIQDIIVEKKIRKEVSQVNNEKKDSEDKDSKELVDQAKNEKKELGSFKGFIDNEEFANQASNGKNDLEISKGYKDSNKLDSQTYQDLVCFKGFKGPISCIIQSSTGVILVTCYDGNVYLFSSPKIQSLKNENYDVILRKKN